LTKPPAVSVSVTVNGEPEKLDVQPHHTLLDVLRDQLHLTGAKECCAEGECGACTVLINGRAVCSCLIEGLATHGGLDRLQESFVAKGAVQCGFCIPGMVMAAKYLLLTNPSPTTAEIQEGLAGNLCRCGGYHRIIDAVATAAKAEG
jgi:aerobic-type carbon monoxide dehydrogenase small subunit (CoxS/CutS family)